MDRLYRDYRKKDLEERKGYREDYYRELGRLNHKRKRLLDRIKKLEEKLEDLEFIEE